MIVDQTIGSIAMDLKRAALGSDKVSGIFLTEAIKRKRNITQKIPSYIQKILNSIEKQKDREDLLMYSTILQNYSLKYGK